MRKYKIKVSYDGTNYYGWQAQPNKVTITGILENRFKSVFKKNIKIEGASRTDRGVHALGQVAQFETDLNIDKYLLLDIFNNSLPKDIFIRKIEEVDNNSHVRYNISLKTYYYHIFTKRPSVFYSRYGYYYPDLNLALLQEKLAIFIGMHDFRSFCTGYEKENTCRKIEAIEIKFIKQITAYRIAFKSRGFLRHMIRRIVGACIDNKYLVAEIESIMEAKNNNQRIVTAPAHGLLLYKIDYNI